MTIIKQGILLAGGSGTRLHPFTKCGNKHLYPVLDKLVIDHSIETIKATGIETLIITLGGEHFSNVVEYVGDGSRYGLKVAFLYQPQANGIAAAINLCQPFLKEEKFAVILGDNFLSHPIEYNSDPIKYHHFDQHRDDAHIFLHPISKDDARYKEFGIASLAGNYLKDIQEKPQELVNGRSHGIIIGFYIFTHDFFYYFKHLTPSKRGEFEITDIIKRYWKDNKLSHSFIEGDWSDMGRLESIEAVRVKLKQQGPNE